jgi:hypothetical protein
VRHLNFEAVATGAADLEIQYRCFGENNPPSAAGLSCTFSFSQFRGAELAAHVVRDDGRYLMAWDGSLRRLGIE